MKLSPKLLKRIVLEEATKLGVLSESGKKAGKNGKPLPGTEPAKEVDANEQGTKKAVPHAKKHAPAEKGGKKNEGTELDKALALEESRLLARLKTVRESRNRLKNG